MSRLVKLLAENSLGNRLGYRVVSSISEPRALVLAFHNVVPDGAPTRGDRSLHMPLGVFRDILDWLPQAFDVVGLDSVFAGSSVEQSRPRAAITFDDAYEGAISVGIPELHERGLPATVFVVSGAESGQTYWWDALADGSPDGLSDELRETALSSARGRGDQVDRWATENALPMAELSGPFVSASWDGIERVASIPGVTIGSHSLTHANLAVLDPVNLMTELVESMRRLAARIPSSRPWLAYPYGRFTPQVERAAEQAGYDLAFRVDGGGIFRRDQNPQPYRIPRLNVPAGLSLAGFRLRAAGLLGR